MKTRAARYRLARVESIAEQPIDGAEKDEMRLARRRLESLLVPPPHGRGGEPKVPPSMADEDLVNALAQYLELEPVEKQALLERDTPARPLPIAHRAAGDEGHGRPAQVGRRALIIRGASPLGLPYTRSRWLLPLVRFLGPSHFTSAFMHSAFSIFLIPSITFSPWKRPFSMKIRPLCTPATIAPTV